jgi:hypothetical protein
MFSVSESRREVLEEWLPGLLESVASGVAVADAVPGVGKIVSDRVAVNETVAVRAAALPDRETLVDKEEVLVLDERKFTKREMDAELDNDGDGGAAVLLEADRDVVRVNESVIATVGADSVSDDVATVETECDCESDKSVDMDSEELIDPAYVSEVEGEWVKEVELDKLGE